MSTESIVNILRRHNHEPYQYSGRGMMGKQCVGVNLNSYDELWEVAQTLADEGVFIGAPKRDTMGHGIVAYWPQFKW